MSNAFDVVVVGGRVAGASTALLLARAGAKVALVDRSAYGSDTVSTHGLMRAGVMQLSRWGLLDAVVRSGAPPIDQVLFHYEGGDTVPVSIRPGPGAPALYAPRRYALDQILVDAAREAGAQVLHEHSVTGLLHDERGRGDVAGVRVRSREGGGFDVRARFTVGADGIRSVVAGLAGSNVVRQGGSASAVLYRYFADLPVAGYEWAYGEHSAAGLIPTNDGQTCLFVGTTPQRMKPLRRRGTQAAFDALLATAAPQFVRRVDAARPAGAFHGWAGIRSFVRRSHGAGWALVGDAGYYTDPITTHGMTGALRDAELLAAALVQSLDGGVPEQRLLADYERTRDALSDRLFDATEAVAAYDWDTDEIRSLLRQVSSAMSDEVDHLQVLPNEWLPRMIRPKLERQHLGSWRSASA